MNKPFICLTCRKSFTDLELTRIHVRYAPEHRGSEIGRKSPKPSNLEDFFK
jgi:hypothetical protein